MLSYKPLYMKEVIIMALIKCKECKELISDKASVCPHCGYPMTHPLPELRDITHSYDTDLNDVYYDEKNKRIISEFEYLDAKKRDLENMERASRQQSLRTESLINFINDPYEIDEVKLIRCYSILADEDLSNKYGFNGIAAMRSFIKKYNEKKDKMELTRKKRD